MKRNSLEELIFWMQAGHSIPLWLSGAPEVGKTYLSLEFAKMFYDGYFYLNIKTDAYLRSRLSEYFAAGNTCLCDFLVQYNNIPEEWLDKFVFIFDDFENNCDILEKVYEILKTPASKDIGKSFIFVARNNPADEYRPYVRLVELYPLEFDEYLAANGSNWYVEIIRGHFQNGKKIPGIVHKDMLNIFQDYLKTGGMPAVVNEYITTKRFDNIPVMQRKINLLFDAAIQEQDNLQFTKAKQILTSLPEQLLKSNKKFQYTKIRKGTTHQMYSDALNLLENMHLVNRLKRAEIKEKENSEYEVELQDNQYRLYSADFGLLNAIMNEKLPTEFIYDEQFDDEINPYGQLLLENYLLQHMKKERRNVFFWESGSIATVDFIEKTEEGLIPIDVKYLNNNKTKSISVMKHNYEIPYHIKLSASNFDITDTVKAIPYYAMFCL